MTLSDKDAQRRPWCMFGNNNLGMAEEVARLVYVGEQTCYSDDGPIRLALYTSQTGTHYSHCRELTTEELAEHGLTQPPRPWADRVTQWAIDRNIIGGTTAKDQFGKLKEEIDELYGAICENNLPETIDAIGDCSVVLAIIAAQYGLAFEQCQEAAWHEIKDRKGRIVNGTFVKEVSE
jgi:hypothetical protein